MPHNCTSPESGAIKPDSILDSVDFPEPLSPTITTLSPYLILRFIPLRIHVFPESYEKYTSFNIAAKDSCLILFSLFIILSSILFIKACKKY